MKTVEQLLRFIESSPTAFHAVHTSASLLKNAGFEELSEQDAWNLQAGKGYFVTRNQSSIMAFRLPNGKAENFLMTASHTDSPMFKLKDEHMLTSCERYRKLSTEVYGGTILSSWFDRPLSLAGRVILKQAGTFTSHLVNFDRDLLIIPNLAIHFNRTVNSGYSYNPAVDTLPLFSMNPNLTVKSLIAQMLNCRESDICEMELYVYNRTKGTVFGAENEFFASPRLDNLMCMWGTLTGFLESAAHRAVNVFFATDNEETGSTTKQGAGSRFVRDVLERIAAFYGNDCCRMLANSMMVSADNAHAKHPNHPEMSDAQNFPLPGGGVVIKTNAAQKYTTDALSASLFCDICAHAGVPVQHFSNRADLPSGSTLGSISNTQVPLLTVDIGMAQLAMHSSYESAGSADPAYLVSAMKTFYSVDLHIAKDGQASISYAEN